MASNSNSKALDSGVANAKKDGIRTKTVVKVGILGDNQIGKTTLMAQYVEGRSDVDYIEALGMDFMERVIHLNNIDITISIWGLGSQKEIATLMPLVCTDAKVILFMFDLTLRQSLFSIKRWYKEARKENKDFMPFLIGTKFDLFSPMHDVHKQEITKQARKFARKMHAPLIYCSAIQAINIKKIFRIIIIKVFHLKPKEPELHNAKSEPILEYTEAHVSNDDGTGNKTIDNEEKKEEKDNTSHHKEKEET